MPWTREQRRRIYRLRRADLVARMGGRCVYCGAIANLEFHHPYGRTWDLRRVNRLQRLKRYEQDWRAGSNWQGGPCALMLLVLACRSCNGQRNGGGDGATG